MSERRGALTACGHFSSQRCLTRSIWSPAGLPINQPSVVTSGQGDSFLSANPPSVVAPGKKRLYFVDKSAECGTFRIPGESTILHRIANGQLRALNG